jgi:hypothetical protein
VTDRALPRLVSFTGPNKTKGTTKATKFHEGFSFVGFLFLVIK